MENKTSPLLPYEVAELTPRTPIWLRVFCFVMQALAVVSFMATMLVIVAFVEASR